jgi:hypothetical protein
MDELKHREILSIGLIEGLFLGVHAIFVFAWTPILQISTNDGVVNLGAISICFVVMVINFTIIYEIFVLYYRVNLYISLSTVIFLETLFFVLIYYVDSFFVRLILLSFVNGFTGLVLPVNSIIKSQILNERNRALLMNIFRVPLNFYVVLALLILQFVEPLTVIII